MAIEREISTKTDLTKDEAVTEYIGLREYLLSENWTFPVVEKVERRMCELTKMMMEQAIEDKENEWTVQNTRVDKDAGG